MSMPDNQMSVQQFPQMNLNGCILNEIAGNFIQNPRDGSEYGRLGRTQASY